MSDFKFNCPHCEQSLEAPEDMLGQTIECPACNGSIQLPEPQPKPAPHRPTPKKKIVTHRPSAASRRMPPPRSTSPSAMPTEKFGVRQIVGIVGAIILFIGVFTPIVSVPIMGNMNYFQNGKGDGTIVLVLAVLSLVAVLIRKDAILFFTSLGCLGTLTFTFVNFKMNMSRMLAEASSSDDLFSGLAQLAAQAVQLQWGWALLVVGSCLTLAPIFLKSTPEDSSQRDFFKLAPGWRVTAGILSGLCCVAVVGALVWPATGTSKTSQSSSMPGSASTSPPAKPAGWQLRTDTSPIDDSKSYFLSRDAEDPIGSGFMSSTPSIMIRYKEGDLEVYITFGTYLGSDSTMVTTRLGSSPATQREWGLSTDGKAIFCPTDNAQFVRQLLANDRLVIRLTPFGESPVTSTFDLTGLSEAIAPMQHLIR